MPHPPLIASIMKLLLIIYLFFGLSNICSSQSTHIIEPAQLEIIYNIQYGKERDAYCLRYGKNASQYFSINNLRSDSLRASSDPSISSIPLHETLEAIKKQKDPSKRHPYSPGHSDYLYWDLSTNIVSVYTSLFGNKYLIKDSLPMMNWEVKKDSTNTILGYACHYAITKFRGREWTVWYADDIPISLGPWKLNGLPGIILQAECKDYMVIEANSIKTKSLTPVTFYNFADNKYQIADRTKILEMRTNPNSYPVNTKITPQMELE